MEQSATRKQDGGNLSHISPTSPSSPGITCSCSYCRGEGGAQPCAWRGRPGLQNSSFPLLPIFSGGAASNAGWKQRRDKASRSSPRQDHVCRAKGKSRCHFHTDVILIQALDEKEKPGGGKKGGAAAANINLASFTGVLSPLHLVPHDDEKGGRGWGQTCR